jgi:type I restriction enzyme S subunit
MTVKRATVGQIATRVFDEVAVQVDGSYETVGILNRGRGLFRRPAISGAETSYATFYRISAGQLVYSKLFAWEGSIAIVPEEFDGTCVSPEFPTFELDREHVNPEYLSHVIRWAGFTDQLAASTTGLGQRRQRVNVEDLVQIEVPLPKITEQRRIALHLESLEHLHRLEIRRRALLDALLPATRNEIFSQM